MKKEDMDYETQVLIDEAKLGDKDALNRVCL